MKFEIIDDIFKSNHEQLSKLNQTVATTITGGYGTNLKNKYEVINYLNDKYDAIPFEITCSYEAQEFWSVFVLLYQADKVSSDDFDLGKIIIDRFS